MSLTHSSNAFLSKYQFSSRYQAVTAYSTCFVHYVNQGMERLGVEEHLGKSETRGKLFSVNLQYVPSLLPQ